MDHPLLTEWSWEYPFIWHSRRNARGIHLVSIDDEADVADLKVAEELGTMTPVPQMAAPPHTRTSAMNKTNPRIPDLAEIAEVDGFERQETL
jgi:hypothetical protein